MVEGDCVNDNLIDDRKSGAIKLQIVPAQPKTLSHLPTRPPVDLAFHDLVYSVREGRRNRKYQFIFTVFMCRIFVFQWLYIPQNFQVSLTECTLWLQHLRSTHFKSLAQITVSDYYSNIINVSAQNANFLIKHNSPYL